VEKEWGIEELGGSGEEETGEELKGNEIKGRKLRDDTLPTNTGKK